MNTTTAAEALAIDALSRAGMQAQTIAKPDRKKFLGGSDTAAVMGLSPWETPLELWQEKTGQKPPSIEIDLEREKRFRRGHKLEPFIRDMVIEKLQDEGLRVELLAINERYQDPEHPFLACELDFELRLWGETQIGQRMVTFDGEDVNADAKSVSGFARKKWGTEDNTDVPIEYACQFMHGMGVRSRATVSERGLKAAPTERRFCLVAALRSFDDVDIYWTERDDEVVTAMRDKCVDFWVNHVLTGVPPDPVNFSDIKLLFPLDNGKAVEASEDVAQKVSELRRVKSAIAQLKEQEESLTFDIGEFISPNSLLNFDGKEIASWKAQLDRRIDQTRIKEEAPEVYTKFLNTKTVRVLRLKKGS
jgi:putative phage-type endonuclease